MYMYNPVLCLLPTEKSIQLDQIVFLHVAIIYFCIYAQSEKTKQK